MDDQNNNVNTPSDRYIELEIERRLPRTLRGGLRAMRKAGEFYLPAFDGETPIQYEARKDKRTFLTNFYDEAVKKLASRVFSKPVQMDRESRGFYTDFTDNVDQAGRDLHNFGHDVFDDGVDNGVSFILVDYTPVPEGSDKAFEQAIGAGPYWVHIRAEDLIDWSVQLIGGRPRLQWARWREQVVDDSGVNFTLGKFKTERHDRVRVAIAGNPLAEPGSLDWLPRWMLWENGGTSEKPNWSLHSDGYYQPVSAGLFPFSDIPLVPFYTKRTGYFEGEPWLRNVAELNLQYYQKKSDVDNIEHVINVPGMVAIGSRAEDFGTLEWGPLKVAHIVDPRGDLKYVEHSGSAIGETKKSLKEIKDEILLASLEPMVSRTDRMTATAFLISESKSHTQLQAAALSLENALNESMRLTAVWSGDDPKGAPIHKINREFGFSPRDAQEIEQLIRLAQAGFLSKRTVIEEAKKRGVLDEDLDVMDELSTLEQEAPASLSLVKMAQNPGGADDDDGDDEGDEGEV